MNFETAVQTFMYNTLSTEPNLVGLGVPVYDEVPQPADSGDVIAFPYLTIGDDSFSDWSTDSDDAMQCVATIHTWSREAGKKETKELQGYIYRVLQSQQFALDGYFIPACVFESSDSFLDPDGITRHGVQKFRIFIEPV